MELSAGFAPVHALKRWSRHCPSQGLQEGRGVRDRVPIALRTDGATGDIHTEAVEMFCRPRGEEIEGHARSLPKDVCEIQLC